MSTQGSISQRTLRDKSQVWDFVVELPSVSPAHRNQVRRRGFRTKKLALSAMNKIISDAAAGLYVARSDLTLGLYLTAKWLPSISTRVRPTTIDTYSRMVSLYLVPELGAVKLQRLDRSIVDTFLAQLSTKGLSAKYTRNIHGVLSKALADALDWGLVSFNAATKAKLPTVEQSPPVVWNEDELGVFLRATEHERWAPLWRVFLITGGRRGEVAGLWWSEVDLDKGVIRINRQRTIAGGKAIVGPPKTKAGRRSIAIDPVTVAALRAWRTQQEAERTRMGEGWAGVQEYVFTNPDGGPIWPPTITKRMKRTVTSLGLPSVTPHGLRHTAATMMMSSGTNPKLVSQRIGHSDVSTTLRLYTHVQPAHDQAAGNAHGAALDRAAKAIA